MPKRKSTKAKSGRSRTKALIVPAAIAKVPQVKDSTDLSNQGIILIRHQAMQEIFNNSGPLAKSNEFQVSYWALNLRYTASDGSILDICIPTVYFNYSQEVTSAHIDFEHEEVGELSNKLIPLHNVKVAELQRSGIIAKIQDHLEIEFTPTSVGLHTLHRHPGSSKSQSFSSTDLSKNPEDLGVVFPLGTATTNQPNFAGIMAIDSGVCNVAHYEYRIANGELKKDIAYQKGRCIALIDKGPVKQPSKVEQMFGIQPKPSFYTKGSYVNNPELFTPILEIFQSIDFQPDTRAIDPFNVKAKVQSTWGNYKYNKNSYQPEQQYMTYNSFLEDDDNGGEMSLSYAKELQKAYNGLEIIDEKKLRKLSSKVLSSHLSKLEKAYYGKESPIVFEDVKMLIEDIVSLQEEIVDEYAQAQKILRSDKVKSVDEMKESLMAIGTPKSMLEKVSDATIKRWYNQAYM